MQVFQAEDTRPRGWMSYFKKKLFNVLVGGKKTLTVAGNFMFANHVDIILEYYYRGLGMEVPAGKRDSLRAWYWQFPECAKFGARQGCCGKIGPRALVEERTRIAAVWVLGNIWGDHRSYGYSSDIIGSTRGASG